MNCNDFGNAAISTSTTELNFKSNASLTSSFTPIKPLFTDVVAMFTIAVMFFFEHTLILPEAVTPISSASCLFRATIGLPPDSTPERETLNFIGYISFPYNKISYLLLDYIIIATDSHLKNVIKVLTYDL